MGSVLKIKFCVLKQKSLVLKMSTRLFCKFYHLSRSKATVFVIKYQICHNYNYYKVFVNCLTLFFHPLTKE